MFKKDIKNLIYVPEQTLELCMTAIETCNTEKGFNALYYISEEMQNKYPEIVERAVEVNYKTLRLAKKQTEFSLFNSSKKKW